MNTKQVRAALRNVSDMAGLIPTAIYTDKMTRGETRNTYRPNERRVSAWYFTNRASDVRDAAAYLRRSGIKEVRVTQCQSRGASMHIRCTADYVSL